MSYYWEILIDKDSVLRHLLSGWYNLVDCRKEAYARSMREGYPTYIQRRYRMYQNGSCVGYTTPTIVQELLDEGKIIKMGDWFKPTKAGIE